MKSLIMGVLAGATLLTLATPSLAQMLALDAAADGDLVAQRIAAAPAMPLANESRDPVSFSWPVGATDALAQRPEPFEANSRQFSIEVSGARLAAGVDFVVEGKGAVVRLSSLADNAGRMAITDLTLRSADGRQVAAPDGVDQLVNEGDLRASGLQVGGRMLGFRLSDAMGSGRMSIASSARLRDDDRYLISVLDRNSTTVLSLRATSGSYLAGSRLSALAALNAGGVDAQRTAAWLVSPDGQRVAASVSPDGAGNGYAVAAGLPADAANDNGLWELHVSTVTANGLQRDAKTAFAVASPVAAFDGRAKVDDTDVGLRVSLGARVASAGRYEARAVLYATAADGERRPLMVAASADWLETGRATLTLDFPRAALDAAGLAAPYALHDLQLIDQSRMAVLERRAHGLTIGD